MCADDHDVASNKGGGGYVLLTNSDNILGDGDVSAGARVADVRTKGSTLAGHGTTQLLAYTTLISPPSRCFCEHSKVYLPQTVISVLWQLPSRSSFCCSRRDWSKGSPPRMAFLCRLDHLRGGSGTTHCPLSSKTDRLAFIELIQSVVPQRRTHPCRVGCRVWSCGHVTPGQSCHHPRWACGRKFVHRIACTNRLYGAFYTR